MLGIEPQPSSPYFYFLKVWKIQDATDFTLQLGSFLCVFNAETVLYTYAS
jgi:hypothetical protein